MAIIVDLIIADASFADLLLVVSRAGLLKMKRLASRPQDLVDPELLEDDGG